MLLKKEQGKVLSYKDYYVNGYLSRKEYRRLTVPAGEYFLSKGIVVKVTYFDRVAQEMGEASGLVKIADDGHAKYRIDRDLMDSKIDELKQVVREVKKSNHPIRTSEEISQAQKSILRRSGPTGVNEVISFDDAYQILTQRGHERFRKWGCATDAETMAQDALIKAWPYLSGERGSFQNIEHFRDRFFISILRSIKVDHLKKLRLEQQTTAKITQESKSKDEPVSADEPQMLVTDILKPHEKSMVEMRLKGLQYRHIAAQLGISVMAVKKRFQYLREKQKKYHPYSS